jgi:preprotein translocase subunit SecG
MACPAARAVRRLGSQPVIYAILIAFHILICALLVLVVLLQSGKGGGLAGAFGGAGGQTGQVLFGGRGAATFLSKATTVLGIAFLTSSLVLAMMASNRGGPRSVIRQAEAPGTIAPPIDAPAPTEGQFTLPAAGDGSEEAAPEIQLEVPAGDSPPAGEGDAGTPSPNPGSGDAGGQEESGGP